jgi:hypothetical protein
MGVIDLGVPIGPDKQNVAGHPFCEKRLHLMKGSRIRPLNALIFNLKPLHEPVPAEEPIRKD